MDRPEDSILDKNLAENELQAALAGNDPAAVELLWNYYASDLFAFLQAVLCSRHDAEDVLQTVFLRIARKRHRLAGARCLDAYVYRIAQMKPPGWPVVARKSRQPKLKVNRG